MNDRTRRYSLLVKSAPLALVALAAATLYACQPRGAEIPAPGVEDPAAELAFRDAVNAPPPGWTGPVFRLSHDYPQADPGECPPDVCRWLARQVDFKDPTPEWEGAWAEYMQDILDYVKEGQDLSPAGWNVRVNGQDRWFHVPWMAYDLTRGREFVHGMTNERTVPLSELVEPGEAREELAGLHGLPDAMLRDPVAGDTLFESWAVGMYNPWGAYAIGQTWPASGRPVVDTVAPGKYRPRGLPFPQGTLVAKILFSTASEAQVPYLQGSPTWLVDRHVQDAATGEYSCPRKPQPVRLVQMDVAVVDERSPTGWVFGTFAYNGTSNGATAWDRMSPVGLQWGNDPQAFPAVPDSTKTQIQESVIAPINIPEHLGCGGRLNGPVDNPQSGCMSCHGGAYTRDVGQVPAKGTLPPIFGFPGMCTTYNAQNAAYFDNVRYPESYPDTTLTELVPLDFSLQLQVAFSQYGQFNQYGHPKACKI